MKRAISLSIAFASERTIEFERATALATSVEPQRDE
jgi:hypothetical protein